MQHYHLFRPVIFLTIGTVTWTNMPTAESFFNSSSAYITKLNLTSYTGVQLMVNKAGTVGLAGSYLTLQYLGNFSTTAANYLKLDNDETRLRVDVQNVFIDSGFHPIINAAKSGVYVALLGSGGNGVLDPIFDNIYAIFT